MNRQKLALFLLLIGLAGSLAYAFLRFPRQQEVATPKNRPGARATVIRKSTAAPAKDAADSGRLNIEALEQEIPGFSGFRRNIFSPLFRDESEQAALRLPPPPPPPLKLPPPPPPVPMAAVPPPPPPPPPPSQRQMDEAELGRITFLGFLKKNGEKTVFLAMNNEIILAKKGSKVGTKFQVTDLTDEAITIKSVNSEGQMVIPLVENRSLSTRQTSTRP